MGNQGGNVGSQVGNAWNPGVREIRVGMREMGWECWECKESGWECRESAQLTHDIVTTLGFGCILVATSDDVVTTLCLRSRYYDQKLTLLQRCVFDIGFSTWY